MPDETAATGQFSLRAYGASLRFESADAALLGDLREDFAFFRDDKGGQCAETLKAVVGETPPVPAGARLLWRNRKWAAYAYPSGSRLVRYPEGALCEFDYLARRGLVRAGDRDLARELAYLLILSRLGEQLDLLGLHRLHAMAAEFGGSAFAAVAPPGGGKTTLLLGLAKEAGFTPLANDTPLVDGAGRLYPFPLRVALGADSPYLKDFPPAELRPFNRRHYPPKYLLPAAPLPGAPGPARCSELFLLKRTAGGPAILPVPRAGAALELLRSLVLGCGVPQIAEFFLRPELADLRAKAGIALGRAGAARALLKGCGVFEFRLSPEPARNASELRAFLSGRRPGFSGNII
jgi:hypothetical protein